LARIRYTWRNNAEILATKQDKSHILHGYIFRANFRKIHWAQWFIVSERRKFGLGLLGFVKYPEFAAQTLNDIFGVHFIVGEHELPLGISFHVPEDCLPG
jgi:hypothetical protein